MRPPPGSTLQKTVRQPPSRSDRLEHFSQSAPLRFAAAVLVGWMLAAGLATGLLAALTGDRPTTDAPQTAGRVAATALLLLLLYRWGWLDSSGLTRSGPPRVWLLAVGAVAYLSPAYVWGLFGLPGLDAVRLAPDAFWQELPIGISVGIAEEFLFRGILLFVLVRAWGATRAGVVRAVLATSLVFGLMHATPALVGGDLTYVAANLLGTIVSAVWWAALVLAYRTVWPGIVIHALTNSIAMAVAGLVPQANLGPVGPLRVVLLELPWLLFGLWLLMDQRRFPRREKARS